MRVAVEVLEIWCWIHNIFSRNKCIKQVKHSWNILHWVTVSHKKYSVYLWGEYKTSTSWEDILYIKWKSKYHKYINLLDMIWFNHYIIVYILDLQVFDKVFAKNSTPSLNLCPLCYISFSFITFTYILHT